MPSNLRRSFCGILLLACLAGCHLRPSVDRLSPPAVTLELQNLSDREKQVLRRYVEGSASRRWLVEPIQATGTDTNLAYRIQLHSWSEHQDLHADLVRLRTGPGEHPILKNHRATAQLEYTSSKARSESNATVTISVQPAEARLVFDSRLPAGTRNAVVRSGGDYRINLPFAFIRKNEYLYFHSIYKGQYRYYRYHLDTQRQEPIRPKAERRGR